MASSTRQGWHFCYLALAWSAFFKLEGGSRLRLTRRDFLVMMAGFGTGSIIAGCGGGGGSQEGLLIRTTLPAKSGSLVRYVRSGSSTRQAIIKAGRDASVARISEELGSRQSSGYTSGKGWKFESVGELEGDLVFTVDDRQYLAEADSAETVFVQAGQTIVWTAI